jgi:hypothetical protein
MNGGNQIYSGYNKYSAGKNMKEGDSNEDPIKMEEPKKEGYPKLRQLRCWPFAKKCGSDPKAVILRSEVLTERALTGQSVGYTLLAIASMINLGCRSQPGSATIFLFFPRFLCVLKWGLFFDEMRGLTTTHHSPTTGGESWWEVALCNLAEIHQHTAVTQGLHFLRSKSNPKQTE